MKLLAEPLLLGWRLLLHRWAHFYYVLDKPQTEDRLYDINYNDLKAYEKKFKKVTKNSPTQAVGCGCPHCKPKMFTISEREVWDKLTYDFNLDPVEKIRKLKKTSTRPKVKPRPRALPVKKKKR